MKKNIKFLYLFLRALFLFPFCLFRRRRFFLWDNPSILFLRHDRLGDMVLSTVVFKGLKSKYPKAKLTVVASARNKEVLENNPYVDEVLVYQGFDWFLRQMRVRSIDLAIDPFYTYELKQAFLVYLTKAKFRIGFEISGREIFFNLKGPREDPSRSMVGHLKELLVSLGIRKEGLEPELYLRPEEIQWAKDFLSEKKINASDLIVGVHPGGFYPSQRWPIENFADVAQRLVRQYKAKVLVFGDHSERNLLESLKLLTSHKDIEMISEKTVRQLMALLSQCRLLVCNNSGVLHVAAALKIPTVSTMGPTDAVLWKPTGEGHIVIRKDLPCRPCDKAQCAGHECLKYITVMEVMSAVEHQLKEGSS